MAADRPLAERRIVEIKMGRSKFPGKPSKIGNRKRVNLSSCALPDDNDSSKAAKNIYLGLSVFNETFGDNEMVAPGPFHGFSLSEVEEAMAEARLQQKEAEVEHKKQGINLNFWESFQRELFSITSCSSYNKTTIPKSHEVNKTKLSFDGGGLFVNKEVTTNSLENSDNQPSKTNNLKNVEFKKYGSVKMCKSKSITRTPEKKVNMSVKFSTPRLKISKLQCSPASSKSLQSQAAKKLLEKAKMSNLLESNKNSAIERKFVLPSHSIHSARVIKPNKRFFEENENKRKLLRSKSINSASETVLSKKPKVVNSLEGLELRIPVDKKSIEELKIDVASDESKRKVHRKDNSEGRFSDGKSSLESSKNNSELSTVGKVILREARLQLDNSKLSLLEGPFSSRSASSLSPNSHLKINPIQSVTAPGSIVCGVCGVVRFYRFVELAKKFGIYCCESCRKFISKIIKSYEIDKNSRFQCAKGKGLCGILPIVKRQHFTVGKCLTNSRCQACWLKLCLKNFKMPVKLKQRLLKLLPVNMQMSINLELSPVRSNDITNKFMISNSNIKDFKWLHENSNSNEIKDGLNEKSLRKRNRTTGMENRIQLLGHNGKNRTETDEKNRQSLSLKGPRVKHVCRSASVVLGQPLATFPTDPSPTKKQTNETTEDCKNCDDIVATNNCSESQVVVDDKSTGKEVTFSDVKQGEKKTSASKQGANIKSNAGIQQNNSGSGNNNNKQKKKTNAKAENPVSMDFWESYDPDEICETGFGLIGSEPFSVRALCFLCGSSGQEKLIHCASCCEPYHEFCVNEGQLKLQDGTWKYDWICPRCTVCATCGRTSGQQLKCIKCCNSYHTECVDRVGGRLLHSPDRPWVCSVCLRCKSCNGVDVSVFVGNLPLCKACFVLRQKGNYCPLCQRCYEDDDYDSKMMECGQCKCWVHAKCEGLSDEKYQVLSFLPESVEYICRMCCVMPPAPWWIAVEAELKSGYLGVLKALSKNRKACTMLKWSPRKQCTCRQVNFISRALDFEDKSKTTETNNKQHTTETSGTEDSKTKEEDEKSRPGSITERKTSIEVISHPTESLKLTLKIMKGTDIEVKDTDSSETIEETIQVKKVNERCKDGTVRVKKCPSSEENSEDSLANTFDCHEDSQNSLNSLYNKTGNGEYDRVTGSELPDKRSLSSPLNPSSDSGIGSTDDELKANCLTDEESCKTDEQQTNTNRGVETKCDSAVSFLEEKRECFCFLEVDSYNSRSKPFSPNLMSIKKKVTTSEYSSLHQFHQDMQRMIGTTQSVELMDLYHQTIKEIFPWFDPKCSKVQSNSQKVSGNVSLESTPVKNTPTKSALTEECKVPKEKLIGQSLDYFYSDCLVEDDRVCLLCKTIGDGPPGDTGRLLYCGQNEWVHCNCALWSGEVFEEIDGSLQNVHSAISRGRSIRCPQCNLKGASIGCCARNCQETYHFRCARKVGCKFMDDKTVYCPAHTKECTEKLVQNEKEFEIRRPVYVELDKRKMKIVDSSQIRFAVGALQVNNLGRFVMKLSDREEAIIPEQFRCTRLFWSCLEPWRIVRYHFTVRLLEVEDDEGVDFGVNLTIDHSKEPELVELKLKQLKYFQENNTLLDINEKLMEENIKEKRKLCEIKSIEEIGRIKVEEPIKANPVKRPKKDHKVVKKIFDQYDSKEDENCLSDAQNTADLLPPDLEEAIFKDLPNDILDGISMQDIFMDIKNDSYENNAKEMAEDEVEYISESLANKTKKIGCNTDITSQNDFWMESNNDVVRLDKSRKCEYNVETTSQNDFWMNECRQDMIEEPLSGSKIVRDLKRSKSDGVFNQQVKKTVALKTQQKSCSLNWNCKTEGPNNKWKKVPKCHVTVNLLEPQERGNMLQELKFTDGLVTVGAGTIDSVKDLKARLEDGKRSIQQEEGKENKCLPWHTRLQPRLLQVDGGVDSSSSGSEAGESPQRLIDESSNSKLVPAPQTSPFLDSPTYSINSPMYPGPSSTENLSPNFASNYSGLSNGNFVNPSTSLMNLPQLDGINDTFSDGSDSEDYFSDGNNTRKRARREDVKNSDEVHYRSLNLKINQCDGGVDSESEDADSTAKFDDMSFPLEMSQTKDEPVKCQRCHCTYRTKISYQRHLETCCSDFMLSSSEGEMSEEESPKKVNNEIFIKVKTDECLRGGDKPSVEEITGIIPPIMNPISNQRVALPVQSPDVVEKLEVKKEKAIKRTYTKKKPAKKTPVVGNTQQVEQILVQQPNIVPPALIVQDITTPNVVPATFIDSGPTIGYVAAMDSQNPFGKSQLIATPSGLISGNFQFPITPETQILGGLCINPQNMQTNLPGIIIQQPHPQGTLISSQPGPVMVSSDQMMLGSTGLFELIRDPRTGGMFIASHNQPVFYNMETMVSNTVMQTNQFISNVLATSSFSQTSTQVFQTSKLEQVVNVPSNYIVVGPNPTTTDKIISSNDLICVQTPQTLIPNQTSIHLPNQSIFNPSIQAPQAFGTEPKLISTPVNPVRCLQPLQVKQICQPIVLNKIANTSTHIINQPMTQVFGTPETNSGTSYQNTQIKAKPASINKTQNQYRSVPMMRPSVTKSPPKSCTKAVITPKVKPQQVQSRSRALVDYINNFRSDICDSFPVMEETPTAGHRKILPDVSPPLKPFVLTVSSTPQTPVVTPASVTNVVHSSVQNVRPTPSPVVFSSQYHSEKSPSPPKFSPAPSTPPVQSPPKISPPPPTTPPISPPLASPPRSVPFSVPNFTNFTKSISVEIPIAKYPETSLLSKTPEKTSPVVDDRKEEPAIESAKSIVLPTNNLSFEEEIKMNLSMPSLDESPSLVSSEPSVPPSPQQPVTVSPKGGTPVEVLPLQENSRTINTGGNLKSPQKLSPVSNKNSSPSSEEKIKSKKKMSGSDQNSPESNLVSVNSGQKKQDDDFSLRVNSRKFLMQKKCEEKGPKLIFDVISDDGFKSSSTSIAELWANICDSVQEMRAVLKIPPLPVSRKGHEILGMQNHGLRHCLEQLRGVDQCVKYKCKYFIKEERQKSEEDEIQVDKENLTGCARTEKFTTRKEFDMFAWLASRYRVLPKLTESAEETISSIRRANSLPMAMRYRNLKELAKLYLGVYRSKIHGKGLFCLREIEAGEMVIEYAGEVIRSTLTDKREKYYTDKGIGCYMFRIDDHFVVDATMKGNAARFINHSCEPNCYSRVVDILGKKHIVIFALRRINIMEELTYDYKFPFEDEKISCHCLSKKCRKYLN